jgi:WD40 repeat protein
MSLKEKNVRGGEKISSTRGYLKKINVCVYSIIIFCSLVVSLSLFTFSLGCNQNKKRGSIAVQQNEKIREIARLSTQKSIDAVEWSPNGKYLAALSNYGSIITIWDTQTWKIVNEFKLYGKCHFSLYLGFLTNNTVITAAPIGQYPDQKYDDLSKYFNLVEWDIYTGKLLRYLPNEPVHRSSSVHKVAMEKFTISNDHSLIAGIESDPNSIVSVVDAKTGRRIFSRVIPIDWGVDLSESQSLKTERIIKVAFSSDGKHLAVGTGSGQITNNNKTIAAGGRVYILNSLNGKILKSFWAYRWEPDNYLDRPDSNGQITGRNKDIYEVSDIIFSPDGRWIVTAKEKMANTRTADNVAAAIWDAKTGTKICDIQGKVSHAMVGKDEIFPITSMVWYDNWLAIGDGSGAFRVYSLKVPHKPVLIHNDDPTPGADWGTGRYANSIRVTSSGLLVYCRDNEIHVLQINNH